MAEYSLIALDETVENVSGQLKVPTASDTAVVPGALRVEGSFGAGAIDDTPIGVGTPDTGAFTDLSVSGSFQFNNPADTFQYILAGSAITADRTMTLPLLTGNDTFVFAAHAQTLTNKTITSPTINTPTISGGSANNMPIGASTANTVRGTTIEGTDTTDATSTTAAAMKTAGGLATVKDAIIGGSLSVLGDTLDLSGGANIIKSVTQNITAGTTQTQGGATAMTSDINWLGTVANTGDSVKMPPSAPGLMVLVANTTSTNSAWVWPNTDDNFLGNALNARDPNALAPGEARLYYALNTTTWMAL